MEYISVREFATKLGVSERTARNWCAAGKINGAFLTGKTWNIPSDATIPSRINARQVKVSPLLSRLIDEKSSGTKGGIYHRTQIDLTYNSNHIEGSRLSHDQTRYIFETNTIGIADESVNVDDIVETVNHFRCIDLIIDKAQEKVSENLIKEIHKTLKSGTSDSRKPWFNVGEYKRLPNEVGGIQTCLPESVHKEMSSLIREYNAKKQKGLDDVIDFHKRFESIHPFQDGNGRVGRLIMFKECLCNEIVPFIITDDLKMFYYRGLQNWPAVPGYLRDTCLTAQDNFKALLEYFQIKY
ncbi:MAG: Fic family protein [Bacteroidia bacterium]|nr:Fic family protein [Bacteroidia bacterium]